MLWLYKKIPATSQLQGFFKLYNPAGADLKSLPFPTIMCIDKIGIRAICFVLLGIMQIWIM